MAEVVEARAFVAVFEGATLGAVADVEEAAAALGMVANAVLVERLGAIVRARLRGRSFSLSVERADGTLALFRAPDSGRWSTVVETDARTVSIVEARSGSVLWPSPTVETPPTSLHFSNGRTIAVDRTMLIGRSPRVERVASVDLPALVPLGSDDAAISRTHLRISVDGERSLVEDLASTNGTAVAPRGGVPHALAPGEIAELLDGMVVTIADRLAFRVVHA